MPRLPSQYHRIGSYYSYGKNVDLFYFRFLVYQRAIGAVYRRSTIHHHSRMRLVESSGLSLFGHLVYDSTLSCPTGDYYHRHHPATGQSGILFSKLPRLNQCIALNGVLLVTPPPSWRTVNELFIPSTQFCKGVRLSGSQSEIQVQIIIALSAAA